MTITNAELNDTMRSGFAQVLDRIGDVTKLREEITTLIAQLKIAQADTELLDFADLAKIDQLYKHRVYRWRVNGRSGKTLRETLTASIPRGKPENQCDGCTRGLRIDDGRMHRTAGGTGVMFCTADLYSGGER